MAHTIEAVLKIRDNMSASLKIADSNLKKFGKNSQRQGRALKDFGRTTEFIGKDLLKLNAPFLAVGGWASKLGVDFQSVSSEAQAVMQATKSEMTAFENKAREVGKITSKSATESMGGIKLLGQAGLKQKEILELTYPLVRLSEAGNLDMARSADLLTNSMKSAEIPLKNAGQYLDQIALSANISNTNIEQQMEAWNGAGGAIDSANMGMSEANALFGIMANRGIKGAESGNAVSRVFQNLNATTGEAGKAMQQLGIDVANSDGSMRNKIDVLKELKEKTDNMTESQKEQILQMIGGKAHTETLKKMLAGLGAEYDDLKGQLDDSNGALEKMAKTMKDNLKGSIEEAKSALEEWGLKLANALIPRLQTTVNKFKSFVDSLNKMSKEQINAIISIVLFTTKLALALIGIGKAIRLVGQFKTNIGKLARMFAEGSMLSNIFGASGLKLAGILGIISVVIIAVVKNWDKVGPAIGGAIRAVKNFIKASDGLLDSFKGLKNAIGGVLDAIAQIIAGAFQVIEGILTWNGEKLKEGLKNIVLGIVNGVKNIWHGLVEFMSIRIEARIRLLEGMFPEAAKRVRKIWQGLKQFLKHPIETIVNIKDMITDKIKNVKQSIKDLRTNAKETIKAKVTATIKSFKSKIADAKKSLIDFKDSTKDEIKAKAKLIAKAFPEQAQIIKDKWKELKESFSEQSEAVAKLKDEAKEKIDELKNTWNEAKKDMAKKLEPVVSLLKKNFADGIKDVKEKWAGLKKLFKGGAKGEVKAESKGGAKSPKMPAVDTSALDSIKEKLNEIKPAFDKIKEAGKGVGLAIIAGFGSSVLGVVEAFITSLSGLIQFITGVVQIITGLLTGDMDQVIEGFKTAFKGGIEYVKGLWQSLISVLLMPAEAVVKLLEGAFPGKAKKIRSTWNTVKNFLKNPGQAVAKLKDAASAKMQKVKNKWAEVKGALGKAAKGTVSAITGAFHTAISKVRTAWSNLKKFFKNPIKGTVSLAKKGASWVGGKLGKNWQGTSNWRGGMTTLHEKGGEIFDLPERTRVYPHDKSVQMARKDGYKDGMRNGNGKTFILDKIADTIVVREEADIERIADKLATKLEGASSNMA